MKAVGRVNRLASEEDIKGFVVEGEAAASFPLGRLRLESKRAPSEGQAANFVVWFPEPVGENFLLEWLFWPLADRGLAMLFFSARRRDGACLFAAGQTERTGEYDQYRYGEIDTFHLSYFRRSNPEERALRLVNLRRSHGFHLLAQGADPIPTVSDSRSPYRLRLEKRSWGVRFYVEDIEVLHWRDNARTRSGGRGGGHIGFRQMSPLIAEYGDVSITDIE